MNDRVILHSDANCFYASVEMLLNPELQDKAIAVCGSEDDRHGIVLAKSEKAKRMGVKTGQANWEARQACPGLICVPPHYEQYNRFSMLLRNIYRRYTDLVEPYGMDECWQSRWEPHRKPLWMPLMLRSVLSHGSRMVEGSFRG